MDCYQFGKVKPVTHPLREAIEAVRAAVEYDLPMTPVAVILLCDKAEKALARLTRAERIIAEKNKALRHIIEDARETTFGPVPKASTKHRKMAGYALALTLDEEQKP